MTMRARNGDYTSFTNPCLRGNVGLAHGYMCMRTAPHFSGVGGCSDSEITVGRSDRIERESEGAVAKWLCGGLQILMRTAAYRNLAVILLC